MIKAAIRKGTISREIIPIFVGASLKNVGVQPLLDGVVAYLPSPWETPPIEGLHLKQDKMVAVAIDEQQQPLGLVFKIQFDREMGALSFVRMYSGTLKRDKPCITSQNENGNELIVS